MRAIAYPWLLALAVISLGGCASVGDGPTYEEVRATAPMSDKATVYVYRKYAEPIAWPVKIYFGNQEVAALSQGTFTRAHLAPGTHQVRGVWPGLSGQQDARIEIEVKAATRYYLEVTGVSRGVPGLGGVLGAMYPLRLGSGINEISAQGADSTLGSCCTFRQPAAITD